MYYNLQLIYEQRKYYHTESFVETHTIYESPFNSYIMYHPIITGIIHDNIGYYKRVIINLKNIKTKGKLTCILNELEKNYQFIYAQTEEYYKSLRRGIDNGNSTC